MDVLMLTARKKQGDYGSLFLLGFLQVHFLAGGGKGRLDRDPVGQNQRVEHSNLNPRNARRSALKWTNTSRPRRRTCASAKNFSMRISANALRRAASSDLWNSGLPVADHYVRNVGNHVRFHGTDVLPTNRAIKVADIPSLGAEVNGSN